MKKPKNDRIHQLEGRGWRIVVDGTVPGLNKDFEFKGFTEALSFMTYVGFEAEKRNHHPEWLNVYNKVSVRWTTHEMGEITDLDYDMAELCDNIATRLNS